ncbi:hypothetical protein B0A63_04875 [Flavobacterium johnsoniae UW101]|nr:hypothetical protein B0A63_04875 [Flavobacterium johnsoniae UW101]
MLIKKEQRNKVTKIQSFLNISNEKNEPLNLCNSEPLNLKKRVLIINKKNLEQKKLRTKKT